MTTSTESSGSGAAAPVWTRPDVYSNLRSAFVRGSRNFHRLEHLGRRGDHTLSEETITDLLVADMSGKTYDIAAPCPLCSNVARCLHWDGSGRVGQRALHVRTLTKVEEGGHRGHRKYGAHADFVIAVGAYDPENPNSNLRNQVRLLVQAKRVRPADRFLVDSVQVNQYRELVGGAAKYSAAPYYALYVQQPDAHSSSETACTRYKLAADRAIVLVPASSMPGDENYLPGMAIADVIALGHPLRCLAGCPDLGSERSADVAAAATAFVRFGFPAYQLGSPDDPMPEGRPVVETNAAQYKPAASPENETVRAGSRGPGRPVQDLLVVRLGAQTLVDDGGRTWAGFGSGMTEDELRDAARMYWRLNPARAEKVKFLVASVGGEAVQAYVVREDGLTIHVDYPGARRASFEVDPVPDSALRERLLARANAALAELTRGAANPVLYVESVR